MQNESMFIWALWGAGALLVSLFLISLSRILNLSSKSGTTPEKKQIVEVEPILPPSNVGNVRPTTRSNR